MTLLCQNDVPLPFDPSHYAQTSPLSFEKPCLPEAKNGLKQEYEARHRSNRLFFKQAGSRNAGDFGLWFRCGAGA